MRCGPGFLVSRPLVGPICHNDIVIASSPLPDGTDTATAAEKTKRRRFDVPPGIALIVAALIGLAGGAIGRNTADNNSPQRGPTVTTTITASPSPPIVANAHLEFVLTPRSKVPWCRIYNGTGTIPAGKVLIIFETPANPDGQPKSPASYSFDGQAKQLTASRWQTEPLQIGTPHQANFNVDIVAVLSSKSTYSYIRSLLTKNSVSTKLPPGPEISLPVVTNGRRGMACAS